jgi:hypothetical protein
MTIRSMLVGFFTVSLRFSPGIFQFSVDCGEAVLYIVETSGRGDPLPPLADWRWIP